LCTLSKSPTPTLKAGNRSFSLHRSAHKPLIKTLIFSLILLIEGYETTPRPCACDASSRRNPVGGNLRSRDGPRTGTLLLVVKVHYREYIVSVVHHESFGGRQDVVASDWPSLCRPPTFVMADTKCNETHYVFLYRKLTHVSFAPLYSVVVCFVLISFEPCSNLAATLLPCTLLSCAYPRP
jgi:hypothetical protein